MLDKRITLVIFDEETPVQWEYGEKFSLTYDANSLHRFQSNILKAPADYILFWDAKNPIPSEELLFNVATAKGNLIHVGPALGLNNEPKLLDAIQPTSILHLDISLKIDHTSWKNTFRSCMLEKRVFETIPLASYSDSLDIIGLDFGFKALKAGVITRFSALLSNSILSKPEVQISKKDELLFIRNNFDSKAFFWSYLMNIFKYSPIHFIQVFSKKSSNCVKFFKRDLDSDTILDKDLSVSVVIATLDRYETLKNELLELSHLDIPLKEIIIVDQTAKSRRSNAFLREFKNLPINYIQTDIVGQCSARNLGISNASGKFVWFLDDDMKEIPTNYLKQHLITLYALKADISCGIPDEVGTNYIDRSVPKISISDGFPTNDVLVKRSFLNDVHGFDEKMDQLQSEDQEIGIRLVKKGALSIKNNQLRLLHLRAAMGGLRNHNVRKITFASSRTSLFQRRFLHYSEIYLSLKHFTKKQVKNALFLNLRGTFIVRGGILKKLLKIVIGIVLFPVSLYIVLKNFNLAKNLSNNRDMAPNSELPLTF